MVLRLADGGSLTGRLVDVERGATDAEDAVVVTPETPGVKGRPAKIGDPVRLPLAQVREGRVEVELVRDEDDARGGDTAPAGPQGRED